MDIHIKYVFCILCVSAALSFFSWEGNFLRREIVTRILQVSDTQFPANLPAVENFGEGNITEYRYRTVQYQRDSVRNEMNTRLDTSCPTFFTILYILKFRMRWMDKLQYIFFPTKITIKIIFWICFSISYKKICIYTNRVNARRSIFLAITIFLRIKNNFLFSTRI